MAFLLDVEQIKSGLIIYHRADVQHRKWYCRVKVPNADRYKVVSLKTTDREAAREAAFQAYGDVLFRLKHDVPVFNRPFKEIAQDYLKIQQERADVGEITQDRAAVVGTAIRTLELYVGSLQIHAVGQDKWDNYPTWRRKLGRRPSGWLTRPYRKKLSVPTGPEKKMNQKPVSSWTIRHEMIVFRSIMTYAASRKFIPYSHIPKGKSLKAIERREEFTREEYRALHSKARKWVRDAGRDDGTERREWCREMTYLYTLIMCNTGMRPSEGKNLLWRDVSITIIDKDTRGKDQSNAEAKKAEQERISMEAAASTKSGKPDAPQDQQQKEYRKIAVLNVRAKKKIRRLVAPENVVDYLERVRKIAKVKGLDDHVFSTYDGERDQIFYSRSVRDMLIATDLLKGPAGTERCTYCFRHTYATLRLSEGVNEIMLAEQMGTSVQVIQDHYGHIHPLKNADRILIGMKTWEDPEPGEVETAADDDADEARVNKGAAATKAAKPGAANLGRMNKAPVAKGTKASPRQPRK